MLPRSCMLQSAAAAAAAAAVRCMQFNAGSSPGAGAMRSFIC
jgi:hypothetical protein